MRLFIDNTEVTIKIKSPEWQKADLKQTIMDCLSDQRPFKMFYSGGYCILVPSMNISAHSNGEITKHETIDQFQYIIATNLIFCDRIEVLNKDLNKILFPCKKIENV